MVETQAKSTGPQTDGEVATGCAVCAHTWTEHDAIAARFCTATAAGHYERGCVCTTSPSTKPAGKAN